MSKNRQIGELINYISVDGSGNVVFTTVPAATTNTDKFLVSDSGVLKFRTAAQLLSDIGAQASGSYQAALSGTGFVKISGSTISYDNSTYLTTSSASSTYQPLLTNPVTGTGTNNYIPKFTSTGSTLGNSALNSNGSGVGMYELAYQGVDVNDSVQVILQLTNTRYNSSSATGENKIGFGWGNHFGAGISAYKSTVNTTGFKFYTEFGFNTPVLKMTLSPEGNLFVGSTIGIGVTPSFPLDLLTSSSGTFNTIAQIYNNNFTSGNRSFLRIRQQVDAGGTSSSYFGTGQDSNLYIIANNSARGGDLIINAGTGAATFSSSVTATSLTTGASGGSSVNITTNGNNGTSGSPLQTNLNFYGYASNLNGQIRVDDIAGTAQLGSMKFYTWNSSQVLALTLSHTGAATFTNTVTAITNLRVNSTGATGSAYSAVLINSPVVTWNIVNDDNGESGDLRFYNDSLAKDALRIKRASNFIGIGVNPSTLLHIATPRSNGTNVNVITLSDNVAGIQTPGFGTRIQYLSNGTGVQAAIGLENGGSGTNNESQISFYTQSTAGALTQRALITSLGRLGIQNNNPQGRLEVGIVNNNTTAGGHFFSSFQIPVDTWSVVFYVPSNLQWNAVTEFTWTSAGDFNRSGAAYMRWAYEPGAATLGVVYTLFNNSQNATASFRRSGTEIQVLITGGAADYFVQVRIQGSKAS